MAKKIRTKKLYELDGAKHGIGGLSTCMPKPRKEDKRAKSAKAYAVVFFPQYRLPFGPAAIWLHEVMDTLAKSPATAKAKFLDKIGGNDSDAVKWRKYSKAGWRVRLVRISDMGAA